MAAVVRAANLSVDASTAMFAPQITGLKANVALAAGDLVYIDATTGNLIPSTGAALTAPAAVHGIAAKATPAGQACTIFGIGTRLQYAAAGVLTPGAMLFVSATTPGGADAAASTGDTKGCLLCITDTDVVVVRVGPQG